MSELPDPEGLLKDQYADAANLNARMRLHGRFSTNRYGWHRWVFDRFALPDRARILELGCGAGQLWLANRERIPAGWEITLSDFSPGMLAQARENLSAAGRAFSFQVIDARAIPCRDESFDAVIANHMLYHVPDCDRALAEVRRALRAGGRLYAATNGAAHMRELRELVRTLAPDVPFSATSPRTFALENGAAVLRRFFSRVALHRYPDALRVTEAEPLVAYVLSLRGARSALAGATLAELRRMAQERIAAGGDMHISKDQGMFEATRAGGSLGEMH